MSVLIKNMKMPEKCITCPFAERVPPGRTRCLITCRFLADGYKAPSPERNEFCPLVEQPEIRTQMSSANCISRQEAIAAFYKYPNIHWTTLDILAKIAELPSATTTLYGYQIEHLEMIARVMAKENCTPEAVTQMLQNAGEIAKMVRNEMMEMLNALTNGKWWTFYKFCPNCGAEME